MMRNGLDQGVGAGLSEGSPMLVAAEDARADLLEAILLLADGPTVAAAQTWQQK
ncbi:hypothetical protein AB0M12_25330 [Nocardia vinacea]|uniref:hypothetical protein n=1 Tax=Nocardia vinacea TaxID=96468 RepID=UPI003441DC0F